MKSSESRRQSLAALAGVFFLVFSGSSPVAFGQDLQSPQGNDERRGGNRSALVVSEQQQVFTSVALAVVDSVLALAPVRFRTSGGNSVLAAWVSLVDPRDSIEAGIIVDDGVPF